MSYSAWPRLCSAWAARRGLLGVAFTLLGVALALLGVALAQVGGSWWPWPRSAVELAPQVGGSGPER